MVRLGEYVVKRNITDRVFSGSWIVARQLGEVAGQRSRVTGKIHNRGRSQVLKCLQCRLRDARPWRVEYNQVGLLAPAVEKRLHAGVAGSRRRSLLQIR